MPLAPADLVEWKRDQTIACGQLDEAACLQAQAEGRLMTAEQTMEYALSVSPFKHELEKFAKEDQS